MYIEVTVVSSEQPRSDLSGIARPGRPDEQSIVDPTGITRYDVLLAAIPIALLAGWVAGHVASVPEWMALGAGAVVAVFALVDGLFLNPPT